jgi:hypothetical protein
VKTFERARITGIKLPASFEEAVKPGGGWSYEVTTAKESVTETKGDIRATLAKESTGKVTCANDAARPASQLLPHLTGNMIHVHCAGAGAEDGSGSDYAYIEEFGVFIPLGHKTKTLSTTMTIQKLE